MENMEHMKYWSHETNPESGARFEYFRSTLPDGSNGHADTEALIKGEYGKRLTEVLRVKFALEKDPFGPEAMAYFEGLGLRARLYDDGDYFTRWASYTPLEAFTPEGEGKKYPMIVYDMYLPSDVAQFEFRMGLERLAGRDKFIIASFQNTNWDNVSKMIDYMVENGHADKERIYITGFSYGGYQATAAYMRVPWKFAGCAPCGNDIWRDWDNWRFPYTEGEIETLRHLLVPFVQIVGQYEASNFAPLNEWKPRSHDQPRAVPQGEPDPKNPRYDERFEPCVPPQRRGPDGRIINTPVSFMPHPGENDDPSLWELEHLNRRLYTLGCAPRDIEKCLSYKNCPDDEFHHLMGFYADKEQIVKLYGLKHYIADMYNEQGLNTFRFIVWENGVHSIPVSMGELIWDFFRQFRRDSATGRIVNDPYKA